MTEQTEAIRLVGEALVRRSAEIGQSIADRVIADIPEYGAATREVVDDLRAGATATAEVLARAFLVGGMLLREDVVFVRDLAARRVREGVGLDVFLHAYRTALLAYWDACSEEVARLGIPRDATLALARQVIEAMDFITTQAAEGYLREDNRLRTRSGRAERDLVERLIAGEPVDDRRRHAAAPGLDPAGSMIVAVGRIERSRLPAEEALQAVRDALESALALGRARPLMAIRHGELVLVAPGASSGARSPSLRNARAVAEDEHGIDVRFGVSMPAAGFAGAQSAYREAVLALSHASSGRPIVSLDDLSALESLLVGANATTRAAIASKGRDIVALAPSERAATVATVRAFAASDLNVNRAAHQLHVHPNTVRYRLRRIAATTGHDPTTFAGLVDLICVLDPLDAG